MYMAIFLYMLQLLHYIVCCYYYNYYIIIMNFPPINVQVPCYNYTTHSIYNPLLCRAYTP